MEKEKPIKGASAINALAELMRQSPLANEMIRAAAEKAMQPEQEQKKKK